MTNEAQPQDAFDEEAFLQEAQEGYTQFDTEYVAVPEADYPMSVKQGSIKIVIGNGQDGRPWKMFTARAVIDSDEARKATNLEAPTAKVRFFLDLNEAGTGLAIGKNRNVSLNRLLVATGNARAGWKYTDVEGVPFLGTVKHEVDKQDATKVYPVVVSFAKL